MQKLSVMVNTMSSSIILAATILLTSLCLGISGNIADIRATPSPAPSGASVGTTKIAWGTGDSSMAQAYASEHSRPEDLFMQSSTGSEGAAWISADVMHELRLYVGLPLFVSVVLLSSGACALLLLGAYSIYHKNHGRLATTPTVREALIKLDWPLWILIMTVVFLISNHLLVRGLAVGIWDIDGQYYPYQVLVADYARAGRFIHWDPWSNAGLPTFGDPQVGAFSPVNFIVGLITGGTSSGFIFYWLLMWWLGGLGIFMLARHFKAPPWGGCVVALGFLFCGVYTGHAEHTSFITAFSFLPLIVWRLDSALCLRKLRPAIEAGALWGLSALAGYPGLTIITGCFCALWAIGRWLCTESSSAVSESGSMPSATKMERRPTLWFVVSALVLLLIVGLVVLSPTYIAFFFEGAGLHSRVTALSRERAILRNALHPGALATFASPYLTILKLYDQGSGENNLWPYTDVSSSSIYAGAIIAALMLLALLRQPRDRWRWWLTCLGALSLACALGQTLPLRGWLYDWFYPMRFFRHAAIFRFYYVFAISVLAVIGIRDLATAIRDPADRIWTYFPAVSSCIAVSALLVFMAFANSILIPHKILFLLGYIHALWVWLGICIVAFVGRILPDRFRQLCIPVLLLALAGSDAFLIGILSRQTIIDTREYAKRWTDLDEKHSANLDLTNHGLLREESSCYPDPPCRDRKNDQVITKIPVFNSYATSENQFHLAMVNHPILKKVAVGTERIWFSNEVAQVTPTESSFAAFVSRTETLGTPPLVVHSPENLLRRTDQNGSDEAGMSQVTRIEKLPASERVSVDLIRYLPDELIFNVQCSTDGWLLVTDRWARSWRAEVNGKSTPVYGGNFIFRAVQVSAGLNTIRFTYHPLGIPWLTLASWGTLAAVASCSVYSGFHRKILSISM